jgi:enamine deaminase RidA (YjgF/YER057c/UK114 family)
MKKNKFPIPENVLELLFGLGAAVVIIGALLKITHSEFIFSGNTWLTAGLITEAIIFSITGLRGFITLRDSSPVVSDDDVTDLSGVAQEAQALKLAYQNATSQLEALGTNLTNAVSATGTLEVPTDLPENMSSLNSNVAQTNQALAELADAYNATKEVVATEPKAHGQVVENMDALQSELASLKQIINELNTKYADILGAMKN